VNAWIESSYTRLLIDNHITEDDPAFMSRFDPQRYVERVKQAGVDSAMVYACCHNGNCYYPTRVGHMHANLKGRDIFGETVGLLRSAGITPVAYYTTIYHNHSAKNHPAWRMQDAGGEQHQRRYWFSCVNNREYVEFTKAQIAEVIAYPVEGIFVDMTFWPFVCACASCREKFRQETGMEIPGRVDWDDPAWVAFQRFRERSMVAFTQELGQAIRARRDITVTFQNSPIIMGWSLGQTEGIADSCDYASGDFYGGKYQHILGAKILSAASRRQPFEYMTSRCIDLTDHTAMKSTETLACEAATTLASGGAYFFIDAINPDGTLVEAVYRRLGEVSASLAPFVAALREHRPVLAADTALYFSMQSQINPARNDLPLRDIGGTFDHMLNPSYEEMLGTSLILTRAHIPFRVVRPGDDLKDIRTLILNNTLVMSAEEVGRVRAFVQQGGTLILTGLSSYYQPDGSTTGNLALADVCGVRYSGKTSRRFHYLKFSGEDEYVSCSRTAALVVPDGARVLAGLAEPLFDPDDWEHYASIHSNPPGRAAEVAGQPCLGLAVNMYGRGKCVYLASPLLALQYESQQAFGETLLREYCATQILETNAPASVEVTLLRGVRRESRLIGLVNYQKELPNVPVRDLTLSLAFTGEPREVRAVSGGEVEWKYAAGRLSLKVPVLNVLEMIEVL
jgi:hypothetical protein